MYTVSSLGLLKVVHITALRTPTVLAGSQSTAAPSPAELCGVRAAARPRGPGRGRAASPTPTDDFTNCAVNGICQLTMFKIASGNASHVHTPRALPHWPSHSPRCAQTLSSGATALCTCVKAAVAVNTLIITRGDHQRRRPTPRPKDCSHLRFLGTAVIWATNPLPT